MRTISNPRARPKWSPGQRRDLPRRRRRPGEPADAARIRHLQYHGLDERRTLPHCRYDAQRHLRLRSSRRRANEQAPVRGAGRPRRAGRLLPRPRTGSSGTAACRRRLRCSLPAGRRVDRLVELPCTWPTSCAFGGTDFATLCVTSARFTMTADHIEARRGRRAFRRGCLGTGPSGAPLGLSKDPWFGQRKRRAFGIQRGDGLVDFPVERVRVSEGLMVQMMRLEIAPDGSDVVQFRRILGQPLDGEPVRSGGQRGQGERGGRSLPCLQQ